VKSDNELQWRREAGACAPAGKGRAPAVPGGRNGPKFAGEKGAPVKILVPRQSKNSGAATGAG
jgi:hypothetical protein